MKRTKRAAAVITGILIVAVAFLLARQFNLQLTTAILQGFFAVILVALIVIFQEELRYFFEKVTHWSLNKGLPGSKRNSLPLELDSIGILAKTLTDLACDRIGALVVIRGKDIIDRHLTNCEPLHGVVSEKILKSIFDPHSTGHDGAVVIENQVISSFGCHLPLSKNIAQLNISGTRHAAALGLAELTDALCLVVSEERGTLSVARHGRIDELPEPESLSQILELFYRELKSGQESAKWTEFFRRNYREKALAFSLALALWFVLVHESRMVYRTYDISLRGAELFSGMMVTQIEPENVAVTLSGQRRSFYFLNEHDIKLNLKLWQLGTGKSTVRLSGSDFSIPEGLEYENASPRDVTVTIASQNRKTGDKK
jgi:uncharacterized protein (TIGR00159 family)